MRVPLWCKCWQQQRTKLMDGALQTPLLNKQREGSSRQRWPGSTALNKHMYLLPLIKTVINLWQTQHGGRSLPQPAVP